MMTGRDIEMDSLLTKFERFQAKAGCDRPTSQITATRVWREIKPLLEDRLTKYEIDMIMVGWGHVSIEGRGDLDEKCNAVKHKLK